MMQNSTAKFSELIERMVGLPLKTIREQDPDVTEAFIEKRVGKKLELSKPDPRLNYRGNPLLAAGRIITYDIDAEFEKRFGGR